MVELIAEIASLSKQMDKARQEIGPASDEEARESRIKSVYSSLAIEDPSVTEEEVREVLSGQTV